MSYKHKGSIYISTHAFGRWRTRVDAKAKRPQVLGMIKGRIAAELKKGARINKRGSLELEVRPGIFAVCYPSQMGGWEIATVITRDESEAG
ncbi:MAG: hypothetical protein SCK28_01535 [Bacillota bacterium]|nr:hypothetical protein [Bacillota bacterium]